MMNHKLICRTAIWLLATLSLTSIACNMGQATTATDIPTANSQPSLQLSLIVISTSAPVVTSVPTVAVNAQSQSSTLTISTGVLSVYPAIQDPSNTQTYIVQPGSTITIKADGLQNIASAQFHVPSLGWHGNGWDETPLVLNPGSSMQTQVLVASDLPGKSFPFGLDATTINGQHISSPEQLWVKIDDSNLQPSMGTISVSPYIPSQEIPDGYAALPGSTIKISVDGMKDITSVKFQIPPQEWGKGIVETTPILNPGSHAEIVLVAPMRKASGLITAYGTGRDGKTYSSLAIWVNVETPVPPTATIPFTPSN